MAEERADAVAFVSGRSRLFGIVGDPIEQVHSPEMFTAEFRRRGRDAVLLPIHVRPDDFDACVEALLKLGNLDGLVFTIPYKARATRFADTLDRGSSARSMPSPAAPMGVGRSTSSTGSAASKPFAARASASSIGA